MSESSPFELITASAGSGKTHQLTLRLLRRLDALADALPRLLALTFTNNAAREMRRRVFRYLKQAALGDPETLNLLQEALGRDADAVADWAREAIALLLTQYRAFQVMTIDRFVGRLLRSVAHELGWLSSFELVLDSQVLFEEAFAQIAAEEAALLAELSDLLEKGDYLWDPYTRLRAEVHRLYELLLHWPLDPPATCIDPQEPNDLRVELERVACAMKQRMAPFLAQGLELRSHFQRLLEDAQAGNLDKLVGRSLDQEAFKKHKNKSQGEAALKPLRARLSQIVQRYVYWLARSRPAPYMQLYHRIRPRLRQHQQETGQVLLGEGTRNLLELLFKGVELLEQRWGYLPEHLLLDEFQDTSPAQWAVLEQLARRALQNNGSLFIVGDTKQAIYGFRGGDWQIMAGLQQCPCFHGTPITVKTLETNYRSDGQIVQFVEQLFRERAPALFQGDIERQYFVASGLNRVGQQVRPGREEAGYVTYRRLEADDARENLLQLLEEIKQRGYRWQDVAVLVPRNRDAVQVSTWLTAKNIAVLSHSSLDVRRQPVIDGVRALLRFLDVPIDDLAFGSVLLSPLLQNILDTAQIHDFLLKYRDKEPRYTAFREAFPEIWAQYFEPLFTRVGYLPVYDLTVELYRIWQLFERFPEEEAALAKWLEVVHVFEASGQGGLRELLAKVAASLEDDDWDLPVAEGQDAVTVMTVHKAKGLQFPVVVVLWFLSRPSREAFTLIGDEQGRPQLWALLQDYEKHNSDLAALRRRTQAMGLIDELCRVYVALTRAEHELHVRVVVNSEKGAQLAAFWPTEAGTWGKPTPANVHSSELKPSVVLRQGVAVWDPKALAPPAWDSHALRLGELCHAVLARLHTLEADLENQLVRALQDALAQHPEWVKLQKEAHDLLLACLRRAEIRELFTPRDGQTVHTEWEVVDATGALRRIDRLLLSADEVVVVDFKTGAPNQEHHVQLQDYARLVSALWPERQVRSCLVYVHPSPNVVWNA